MKGKKKIILVLLLALVLTAIVGATTYAIYRSTATATGTVGIAAWQVKIGEGTGQEAFDGANYTIKASDITWTKNVGENGKTAPGAVGQAVIPVDATGSEVGVVLEATLGTATLPDGMTAALASGASSQTIPYSSSNMKANVTIEITWTGTLEDTTAKDTTDKAVNNTTISIPVNLTARQVLPQ